MLAKKVRDLGLDSLGQQGTRSITQDFGELVVDDSWLNQLDDVIFGHGISLLRWRSGGVKHPHDMPPFRFPPSPTFSDSSGPLGPSAVCLLGARRVCGRIAFVLRTVCRHPFPQGLWLFYLLAAEDALVP